MIRQVCCSIDGPKVRRANARVGRVGRRISNFVRYSPPIAGEERWMIRDAKFDSVFIQNFGRREV
jgi:hypothetical protein